MPARRILAPLPSLARRPSLEQSRAWKRASNLASKLKARAWIALWVTSEFLARTLGYYY